MGPVARVTPRDLLRQAAPASIRSSTFVGFTVCLGVLWRRAHLAPNKGIARGDPSDWEHGNEVCVDVGRNLLRLPGGREPLDLRRKACWKAPSRYDLWGRWPLPGRVEEWESPDCAGWRADSVDSCIHPLHDQTACHSVCQRRRLSHACQSRGLPTAREFRLSDPIAHGRRPHGAFSQPSEGYGCGSNVEPRTCIGLPAC